MVSAVGVQLVLAGSWHDFVGFVETVTAPITESGFSLQASFELDTLARLNETSSKIVLLYTCLDDKSAVAHTPAELVALTDWVEQGGALLAIHSTAVAARAEPKLRALLGGAFLSHPPKRRFRVIPVNGHPITAGVEPFEIEDEPYRLEHAPDVRVHAVSADAASTHPTLWSRRIGKGKLVYFALGHDQSAWQLLPFQTLMVQSLGWLSAEGD